MHETADRGMMNRILRQTPRLWIQIDYKGATRRKFACCDNLSKKQRRTIDGLLTDTWRVISLWGFKLMRWYNIVLEKSGIKNPLKMKFLEYSDRPANLRFIPARLHSKVCDISLAWRTEYGHAHDNLFIHCHHGSFFWRVFKRIAYWKDVIKLDDDFQVESRLALTVNPMPKWAFEEVMNLRQLVSMKRRIGDGSHVFHWWLLFRTKLGVVNEYVVDQEEI